MVSYEDAKKLVDMGLSVIPLKEGGKEPIVAWKTFQERRPTDEELHKWFDYGKNNIGIVCGNVSERFFVIDFDNKDLISFVIGNIQNFLGKTYVVQTSRGYHLGFRLPPDADEKYMKSRNFNNLEINLKGEDGYVVAPPSIHPSGITYQFVGEQKIKIIEDYVDFFKTLEEKDQEGKYLLKILPYWHHGERNNLIVGLTEFFKNKLNWDEEKIKYFLQEINRMKPVREDVMSDTDIEHRVKQCYETNYNYLKFLDNSLLRELYKLMSEHSKNIEEKTKKQKEEIQKKEFQDEINSIISKLHIETWYDVNENGNTKFNVQNASDDFINANSNIITEYTGTIHVFTSKGYQKDSENFIKSIFEKAGNVAPEQLGRIVEVIRHKTMIIDPKLIEKTLEEIYPVPEYLLPIENGLLDIREKKVAPHDPRYFYVSYIPRNYIPGAKAEKFREFLNNYIFKDDPEKDTKITQIYEIFAWGIYPKYLPHGAIIFLGSGGEGKSIIHTVLENFFVETTSISVKELEEDKFKRAELYGKFINAVSEAGEGFVRSELFKRTSDFTQILADRKHGQPFLFKSRAKWVIDTNILPIFNEDINALYRRIIKIISFDNYLEHLLTPEQIDEFVNKITTPEELDKLFSEVIDDYYLPFINRKKFTGQYTIEEAQENYQRIVNPANAYIEDRIDHDAILTDINEVKEYLQNNNLPEEYFTAKEKKNNKEHIILIKQFADADAKAWAKEQKLPLDLIDTKNIGSALGKQGYNGIISIKKKIKESNFNAWRDIFIIPHDIKNYLGVDSIIKKSIINDDNRGSTRRTEFFKNTGTASNVSAENNLEAISTSDAPLAEKKSEKIKKEEKKGGIVQHNRKVIGTERAVSICSTDRRGSTSDFEGTGTAGTPLDLDTSTDELAQKNENQKQKAKNLFEFYNERYKFFKSQEEHNVIRETDNIERHLQFDEGLSNEEAKAIISRWIEIGLVKIINNQIVIANTQGDDKNGNN